MPTYVFVYRGPKGYTRTPETGAAWRAWFGGMGEALVDLGKPAIDRANVGNCDPLTTELNGFSLVSAEDMDAAMALAKGCPYLDHDGGVEVGLLGEVPAP
ncbi:MAG TPA: hypothetical protein VGS19_38615 [Streptosporangiaceae bacterium]|nr:hypothetical protein [Streptosporangiaceae bacterium]